jgi:hypothetical protein
MWLHKQSLPKQAQILTGCFGSQSLYSRTLKGVGFGEGIVRESWFV